MDREYDTRTSVVIQFLNIQEPSKAKLAAPVARLHQTRLTLFDYPDLVLPIMSRPQFKRPGSIAIFIFGVFNDEKSVADPEPVKSLSSSGATIVGGVRHINVPNSWIIVVVTI